MMEKKRYHPFTMLFGLWRLVKNSFFIAIYLFVFKWNSESTFVVIARWVFLFFIILTVVKLILNWLTSTYATDQQAFYLSKGIFTKEERTVPFSKIQNVQRQMTVIHKLLGLTSITFETGMTGENNSIEFVILKKEEAERLERLLQHSTTMDEEVSDPWGTLAKKEERIVHFRATQKDLVKAAFTSFSVFLLIPAVGSLLFKLNDFLNFEEQAKGVVMSFISSSWIIAILVIIVLLISISFGLIRTFLQYGQFTIASDQHRIYLSKGIGNETSFSIQKDKVQAIEMNQTFLKLIFRLVEVKLISAGDVGDLEHASNALYPFMPVKDAYQLIPEMLPAFELSEGMERLPVKAFWVRLLKPSWFWMIATGLLIYFQPVLFRLELFWILASFTLLIVIVISRVLNYYHTCFSIHGKYIQFKTGAFGSSTFITKREKVIEVQVKRNKVQQWLGLASIGTVNRAQPVHHNKLDDIPVETANAFYHWYLNRTSDVKLTTDS